MAQRRGVRSDRRGYWRDLIEQWETEGTTQEAFCGKSREASGGIENLTSNQMLYPPCHGALRRSTPRNRPRNETA
jgi:hypothetical protein